MRVCYFGIYNPSYSRNRILLSGLRQNGVEVVECVSRSNGIRKYVDLIKKHRALKRDYDVMVVGFHGYQVMLLAKFLGKKPIIFDCYSSLYDSEGWDRKLVRPRTPKALYYWFLDWAAMKLADVVLFDTNAHIEYASKEYGIKKEKFKKIWIGAVTDVFRPLPGKDESGIFTVMFYGTFIPLQGIEYIMEAAHLLSLEKIHFIIIGNGQEKKKICAYAEYLQLKNVEFIDYLPQEQIVMEAEKADIFLGIFGNTNKVQRVIPNKVYECLAMRKPVITADTPAIRELFSENELALVKTADGASLATGILRLRNERKTRSEIACNGYNKLSLYASPSPLGRQLRNIISEML